MKDPMGWAGSDGSTPAEIEALFRHARPARGMTEAQRLRMSRAVQSIAATPVSPWPVIFAKNTILVVIGVTTTGALLGGEMGSLQNDRHELPQMPQKPAVVAHVVELAPVIEQNKPHGERVEVAKLPQAYPTTTPANPRGTSKPAARKAIAARAAAQPIVESPPMIAEENTSVGATDEDTLSLEIEFIEKARQTMATNPSATLEQLEEYQRTFPAGRLLLAREVLAIDALLKLGRKAEAHARAEALHKRAAGTPYEARVQKQLDDAK